jgi:hypothetical protein
MSCARGVSLEGGWRGKVEVGERRNLNGPADGAECA